MVFQDSSDVNKSSYRLLAGGNPLSDRQAYSQNPDHCLKPIQKSGIYFHYDEKIVDNYQSFHHVGNNESGV